MSRPLPFRLKTDGNMNRLDELAQARCTSTEMQECFALGGLRLTMVNGDFPLLANREELGRVALPKRIVAEFLRDRDNGMMCALPA